MQLMERKKERAPGQARGDEQASAFSAVLHRRDLRISCPMNPPEHPASRRIRQRAAAFGIRFRPVKVKARHDGWTPERQRAFIDRLCLIGTVARAARAVGKTPQSAYRLREHKGAGSFRRAWDEALGVSRSHIADVAIERCIEGETVPVVHRGRKVGEWIRHDNRLLVAALGALFRDERTGAALKDKDLFA